MIAEITIPSPGESISEAVIARWLVKNGDYVEKDQELAEIESDKATLPLIAKVSGIVKLLFNEGNVVKIGSVACTIDDSITIQNPKRVIESDKKQETALKSNNKEIIETTNLPKENIKIESDQKIKITPLAHKLMDDNQLDINDILNGLKKITSNEVKLVLKNKTEHLESRQKPDVSREIKRESLSQLRKKLSARLVSVKNETAMLTTFNEIDMSQVIQLRNKYQKQFLDVHGVKLGFMSLFVKAATAALQMYPKVNSQITVDEILFPQYIDIAFAVQTEKGLMVPVLRNTENKSLAEIEKEIAKLAESARNFKLSLDEMSGGTFTITNGGVFGSMLSTPIINPPQSAILGMHNIVDRPVAILGKVEIRPIMYLALSYDHRNIDGRDSIGFLLKIKELIENPAKLIFEGQDPEKILLGL
jgi:2-oxoglutarate dehydrogenase E2 component (dihydrolipoamide succinyltransferase)